MRLAEIHDIMPPKLLALTLGRFVGQMLEENEYVEARVYTTTGTMVQFEGIDANSYQVNTLRDAAKPILKELGIDLKGVKISTEIIDGRDGDATAYIATFIFRGWPELDKDMIKKGIEELLKNDSSSFRIE